MENKTLYKPDIKKIKWILGHSQIYTIFHPSQIPFFQKVVDSMSLGLSKIKNKNQQITLTEEGINETKKILGILMQILMTKPVTPITKDLIDQFIILASAWNENLAQRPEVRDQIYSLRRLVDYHLSFVDMIKISKSLIQKMEELQKFSPPTFELSRHYLKALQEMDGKKQIKTPRNK